MIDLGYPEGATPLDPDEAQGLLLTHVTKRQELDVFEQEGIVQAESKLFARKPKNLLDDRFVFTLHKVMFGSVWKWAGTPRTTMKSIGIEAWRIPAAVRELCRDVETWIEHGSFPPDEIAARLHHRLVAIHCFPNCNGRHARTMADLLLVHLLKQPRFTWGSQSLAKAGECRSRYIAALQAADRGDYGPLLEFVRS